MPCYSPLTGFRSAGGRLVQARRDAVSLTPKTVRCGQCRGCRLENSLHWAIRITHEARMHERSSFVTFTYDDEHLPEGGTLVPTAFPSFMKRLRQDEARRAAAACVSPASYRYFHVGEYGEDGGRPHYHACLFGEDFREGSEPWSRRGGHQTWTHPRLDRLWGQGNVIVGSLTVESAQYVARYTLKKRHGPEGEEFYRGREREFATMSRRPGIGATWWARYRDEVIAHDEVVVGRHARRPPRYYDYLLGKSEPELREMLGERRAEKMEGRGYRPANLLVRPVEIVRAEVKRQQAEQQRLEARERSVSSQMEKAANPLF